jgi:membrane protease YdiL (CAAX protease family)
MTTINPESQFLPPNGPLPRESGRVPDPGSSRIAWLSALIATLCIGAVIYMNQATDASSSAQRAAKAVARVGAVDLSDPVTLSAKMMMKLAYLFDTPDPQTRQLLVANAQSPVRDASKRPEVERVREVILTADILGGKEGAAEAERLCAAMEAEFADRPDRLARALYEDEAKRIEEARLDIGSLRTIYAGHADSLTPQERDRLIARHGWFAKVALTFGKPHADPERAALLSGGGALLVAIVGMIVAGLIAIMGGLGCFIAMIVLIATGRIRRRFVAPAPGGSFGWEILGAFVAAFLGLRLVGMAIGAGFVKAGSAPPEWLGPAAIALQWVVALAVFFPLLRGVRFSEFRRLLGWTAPRGVFREIGAGIFGYFAGIPLIIGAAIVSLALNAAYQWLTGKEPAPPENPIIEIVARGNAVLLALLFSLAVIWAPIVEETVFRGGLYRALRTRLPMVLAALVSALVFGLMHGYPVLLLGPVITIGFIFALIREWRGSLIGPMCAHALNNATVLTLVYCLLRAVA